MIIDVRTEAEYAEGHLKGAVNIPLGDIAEGNIEVLEGEGKNEQLLLYCRSGARAERARALLEIKGFTAVENLGALEDARRALSQG
jgi:rhodanese-related sulfurtransferase